MSALIAARAAAVQQAISRPVAWLSQPHVAAMAANPEVDNFALGNPQEMPLPGVVGALREALEPRDKDWFGYRMSEDRPQEIVAAALRDELGLPFAPDDVVMTTGAFAALAVALQTVLDPGDEVIINLPPWFFYEGMVVAAGGVPVKVSVDRETFDLDLDAIAEAITPRTRAIIVNTPNNPTGRIYPRALLDRLAAILADASDRHGRPIWLISDEPYRRIRFDGAAFHSPLASWPYALMSYSYGKVLLTPGQRMGYIALPPALPQPEREAVRNALIATEVATGWQFPNAIMQQAIGALEPLSIDIAALQRRRDRMVAALRETGYEVRSPEGTFYLLPRAPIADDVAFVAALAARSVLCLPGEVLEFPGFFRISLTASDAMVERSLPRFADAIAVARAA